MTKTVLMQYRRIGTPMSVIGAVALLLSCSQAKPPAQKPAPTNGAWHDADIGFGTETVTDPAIDGNHSLSGGTLTVSGAGTSGIAGGSRNALHFTYQMTTGDVEIVARVVSFSGEPKAQVGLMLRQNNESRTAMTQQGASGAIAFSPARSEAKTPENMFVQNSYNPGTQYPLIGAANTTSMQPPFWLKIVRVGGDFGAYKSLDGKTWSITSINGGGSFQPSGPLEVGFAVSSGTPGTLATAVFDQIYVGPPRLAYRSSWMSNTFTSYRDGYVSNSIGALYVAPDGTCYTNSYYDEGAEAAKIYKDGKIIGHFPPSISLNNYCNEGTVTGDGTSVFLWGFNYSVPNSAGIYRVDAAATEKSVTRIDFGTTPLTAKGDPSLPPAGKPGHLPDDEARISGMAAGNGELYVGDVIGQRILVVPNATTAAKPVYDPERSFAFTRPGPMVVDRRGDLWIIQEANDYPGIAPLTPKYPAIIKCYRKDGTFTGKQITDVVYPTALAIDPARDRLLVAENGPDQNIRIYTGLDAAPKCTSTFGAKGGIWSGKTPGLLVDPAAGGAARFYRPTGVGADAKGNIYVSCTGGTNLAKYTPDGKQLWQLLGMGWVNVGDFDPDTDGRDFYLPFTRYAMDYSKTAPGSEWSYKSNLWDPFRSGSMKDRGGGDSSLLRRLGPKRARIMFSGGQGSAGVVKVFRFESETAIPCGRLEPESGRLWVDKNGDGVDTPDEISKLPKPAGTYLLANFDVDNAGDIWAVWSGTTSNSATMRHFKFKGLDTYGVPQYSLAKGDVEDIVYPKVFKPTAGHFPRLKYDLAHNAMYLYDTSSDPQHLEAPLLARYDNWSTQDKLNLTPRYLLYPSTPDDNPNFVYNNKRPYPYNEAFRYTAFDVAGDKIFMAEIWGPVHVFEADSGAAVTLLNPGPELSGSVAWQDANLGLRAFKRSNGEYVVVEENSGWRARQNMFRWTPAAPAQPK